MEYTKNIQINPKTVNITKIKAFAFVETAFSIKKLKGLKSLFSMNGPWATKTRKKSKK